MGRLHIGAHSCPLAFDLDELGTKQMLGRPEPLECPNHELDPGAAAVNRVLGEADHLDIVGKECSVGIEVAIVHGSRVAGHHVCKCETVCFVGHMKLQIERFGRRARACLGLSVGCARASFIV
jgi:hypothetical protein